MTDRAALHDLVDRIPEDAIGIASRQLAWLCEGEPGVLQGSLPIDDEPLSAEDVERWDTLAGRFLQQGGVPQDVVERLVAG